MLYKRELSSDLGRALPLPLHIHTRVHVYIYIYIYARTLQPRNPAKHGAVLYRQELVVLACCFHFGAPAPLA